MATFEFLKSERVGSLGGIYHYMLDERFPTEFRIEQFPDEGTGEWFSLQERLGNRKWLSYARYQTMDAAKKGAIALHLAKNSRASNTFTMEKLQADDPRFNVSGVVDDDGHMRGRYIGLTKPKANARQAEDPDFEPIEAYPSIKKDQVHPDGGPAFPQMRNTGLVEMSKDGRTHMDKECTGGMTIREYAAIHLRIPRSGNSWLDEMIREANERDR